MKLRTLGHATDVALLERMGSIVEDRGDHLVIRTPANPGFYWGNYLLLAQAPDDVAPWIARFHDEFPDVAHVSIAVDAPDGAPELDPAGLTAERMVGLVTDEVAQPPRPNRDAELRLLSDDADWIQLQWLHETNSGRTITPDHGVFVARRVAAFRAASERGEGLWAGAFVEGVLRSSLGLFAAADGLARYQAVDTLAAFRRRGLAGTLVWFAAQHARERLAFDRYVIVAHPDEDAIRIYRSLGFRDQDIELKLAREPGEGASGGIEGEA